MFLGPETSASVDRPSDQHVFQHLGAAVMLCWSGLPLGAREQILRQADDVIGLAPVPDIRQEIIKLMLRHAKACWTASRAIKEISQPSAG